MKDIKRNYSVKKEYNNTDQCFYDKLSSICINTVDFIDNIDNRFT